MITLALFLHKAPESAGYGTFIVGMNCPMGTRISYIAAYSLASPFTAFIAFVVFALQEKAAINDQAAQQELNWWIGFILLFATGTLTYITLCHILPEMYLDDDHEEPCHFGDHEGHHHAHDDNFNLQKNDEDSTLLNS